MKDEGVEVVLATASFAGVQVRSHCMDKVVEHHVHFHTVDAGERALQVWLADILDHSKVGLEPGLDM